MLRLINPPEWGMLGAAHSMLLSLGFGIKEAALLCSAYDEHCALSRIRFSRWWQVDCHRYAAVRCERKRPGIGRALCAQIAGIARCFSRSGGSLLMVATVVSDSTPVLAMLCVCMPNLHSLAPYATAAPGNSQFGRLLHLLSTDPRYNGFGKLGNEWEDGERERIAPARIEAPAWLVAGDVGRLRRRAARGDRRPGR
jgi:hypothetical protein